MSCYDRFFDDGFTDKNLNTAVEVIIQSRKKAKETSFHDYQIVYDDFKKWMEKYGFLEINEVYVFTYFFVHEAVWNPETMKTK